MAINPPVINITKPEDAYPGLRAYVKEKRKEGLDDLAITGRIMDWMKEARDQGYSDEEINAKVSGPKLELPKSSWDIPGIAKFAYRGFTEPATPEKQKSLESGFWKGITLGYGQEYDYEPTYGNITADVVGQLMGTVLPWAAVSTGLKLAVGGGRALIPGAAAASRALTLGGTGALARGVRSGLATGAEGVVGGGIVGGLSATPGGGLDVRQRAEQALEGAFNAWNILGSTVAGGVGGGLAYRKWKQAEKAYRELRAQMPKDNIAVVETTGSAPEAAPSVPPTEHPSTPVAYKDLNDNGILYRARQEIETKGVLDDVELRDDLDRRSRENSFFQTLLAKEIDQGLRKYRQTTKAEEAVRTADKYPEREMIKDPANADMTGLPPDELIAMEGRLSESLIRLESSTNPSRKIIRENTAYLLNKVREAIPEARKRRVEPGRSPIRTRSGGGLDLDQVITADYIQRVSVNRSPRGDNHYLVKAFRKHEQGYEEIGLADLTAQQYGHLDQNVVKIGAPDKIYKPDPLANKTVSPDYAAHLAAAAKLFKPGELVTVPRIQNARNLSEQYALAIANDLRIQRGEVPQVPPIEGGSMGPLGPERSAKVEARIRQLKMMQQSDKEGSSTWRLYQSLIDDLEREGKIRAGNLAKLGIVKKTTMGAEGAVRPEPTEGPGTGKGAKAAADIERARAEGLATPTPPTDLDVQGLARVYGIDPSDPNLVEKVSAIHAKSQPQQPVRQEPVGGVQGDVLGTETVTGNVIKPQTDEPKPIAVKEGTVGDMAQVVYYDLTKSGKVPGRTWPAERPERAAARAQQIEAMAKELGLTDFRIEIKPLPDPGQPTQAARNVGGTAANVVERIRLRLARRRKGEPEPTATPEPTTEPAGRDFERTAYDAQGRPLNKPTGKAIPDKTTGAPVRFPESGAGTGPGISSKTLELMAGDKGFEMQTEWGGPGQPSTFRLVRADGNVLETKDMMEVLRWLQMLDNKTPGPSNKWFSGAMLSVDDRLQASKAAAEANVVGPKSHEPVMPPDAPPTPHAQETLDPPSLPPISGGAGDWFIDAIAAKRGMSPTQLQKFTDAYYALYKKYGPEMHAAFIREWQPAQSPEASWNPLDYFPSSQPQNHWNPIIRAVSGEALQHLELPRLFEFQQQIEFYNKNWANLTLDDRKLIGRAMSGSANAKAKIATSSVELQAGYAAALNWADDVATRLSMAPDWVNYIRGIIDFDHFYKQFRNQFLGYKGYMDPAMPAALKQALPFESDYKRVLRSVQKQENWKDLPKGIKDTIKDDIFHLVPEHEYAALPNYMKKLIPEEAWKTFPVTSGMPFSEDWAHTFRALLPHVMDNLYAKPFFERWDPLVQSLPQGNAWSTRGYLERYLNRLRGSRESNAIDNWVDNKIRFIEEQMGIAIADPHLADRLATQASQYIYRSTVGLAGDTALTNTMQTFNAWAESGNLSGAMKKFFASPEAKKAYAEIKALEKSGADIGILHEMQHYMHQFQGDSFGGSTEGVGPEWFRKWDKALTFYTMKPMAWTENLNRGITLVSALEAAKKQGLDFNHALLMGYSRASRIHQPLRLSEAAQKALLDVQKVQFGYGAASQAPYLQNPLVKLLTLFHSYPTKQLQLISNNMGWEWNKMVRDHGMMAVFHPTGAFMRYTALAGLTVGIGMALRAVGAEPGSLGSFLPQLVGVTLKPIMLLYNMWQGHERVTGRQWADATKNLVYHMGVPGQRYWHEKLGFHPLSAPVQKVFNPSELDRGWLTNPEGIVASMQRGFTVNFKGQRMYDTDWSELTRLTGVTWGRAAEQRAFAREAFRMDAEWKEEQEYVLSRFLKTQNEDLIMEFNEKWAPLHPEFALTPDDIATYLHSAQLPYVVRAMKPHQIIGVINKTGKMP